MSTLLALKRPIPELKVQVSSDEHFVVRGLTPVGVFSLYKRHTGQLGEMFDRVMASVRDTGSAANADIEAAVLALLRDAPVLLGELIVIGCGGSPDDIDDFETSYGIATALPFPAQVDALHKIASLTFTSDMPVGKFAALIVSLAQKATAAMGAMTQPILANGSGESVAP